MRLNGTQFLDVVAGHLLEGFVRRVIAVQAARLQAVERPVAANEVGQVPQIQHVAEHAGDQEKGSPLASFARVHRNQMRVAAAMGFTRRRCRGCAFRTGGGPTNRFPDHRRAALHGRGFEQHRDRVINVVCLLDHGEQAHRGQRVAAEVEETVAHANFLHAQQFTPEGHDGAFYFVARLDIFAFEFRAGKFGSAFALRNCGLRGLIEQLGQVERSDDPLRPRRRRHHARKRLRALSGQYPLQQIALQLKFGRRQLAGRPGGAFKFDLRWGWIGGDGEIDLAGQLLDGEFLDIEKDTSAAVGNGDIEQRDVLIGLVRTVIAYPTEHRPR